MSSLGDLLLTHLKPNKGSETSPHEEESTATKVFRTDADFTDILDVSDRDSCSDDTIQPRVPLHVDPEFVDPDQNKFKYGVIYLSYIPEGLNVRILRDIMEQFGLVGRIYLEPEEQQTDSKRQERVKRHLRSYVEGWIEFKKKRIAKSVAKTLNGTPLQYGKRHGKFSGQIWSIKYLHRFKWAHLTEQLAHDKAVRDQKRRFEMSQAKKQSDFYQKMTERSKIMKRHSNKQNEEKKGFDSKPKQNRPLNSGEEFKVSVDEELLTSIFKKVA